MTTTFEIVRTVRDLVKEHFSSYCSTSTACATITKNQIIDMLFTFKRAYNIQIIEGSPENYVEKLWEKIHVQEKFLAYLLDLLFYIKTHLTDKEYLIYVNQLAHGWGSLGEQCAVDDRTNSLSITYDQAVKMLNNQSWLVALLSTKLETWNI